MKKAVLAVLALALLTSIVFHFIPSSNHETAFIPEAEIGDANDPLARLNYEKARLANPITGQIPENILNREMAYATTLPVKQTSFKKEVWQQRGPNNIGGRARALVIDVTNSNVILSGGTSGGAYRSEDGGKTWNRVTGSTQLMSVTDIVQDTRTGKTNTWYYCTGEVYGNTADFPGDGIFKSTDGGKTWAGLQIENKPHQFRHLNYGWRLCLDHTRNDSDILFLASYGGILRSNDGGQNWKLIMGGESESIYLAGTDIAQTRSGVFYATLNSRVKGNNKGIFRSEDGLQWTNITPSKFPNTYGRIVFDIFEGNEHLLYFLAHTPTFGKTGVQGSRSERNSLWKYNYLGGNGANSNGLWTDLSDNIPAWRQDKGLIYGDFIVQGGYNQTIAIKPSDSNVVAIGGTNLFLSTNGFKTDDNINWIGGYLETFSSTGFLDDFMYKNHHPDIHNLLFHPDDDDKLLTTSDGGVHITNNVLASTVEWTSLNDGFITSQFYAVSFNQNPVDDHALSDILLGGFQDNETQYIKTSDNTNGDWERIGCCDGSYSAIFDYSNYTYVLTSAQNAAFYLYRLDADGKQEAASRIDPTGAANFQRFNQFILDPFNSKRLYYPCGSFLFVNSDLTKIPLTNQNRTVSTNWTRYLSTRLSSGTMISIDASPKVEGLVFVGTTDGNVYRIDNAHDANNNSITSITENKAIGGTGRVESVSCDPHNANNILVAFSNYERQSIFYTEDGGQNWRHVSGNLEENEDGSGAGTAVNVVKIVRSPNGPIYMAGTNTGLYSTTGLPGENTVWNREGANSIGLCAVRDIDYRDHDKLLFVGTHGCGSFSANIGEISSLPTVENELPISVYPNPTSEQFTIELSEHSQGHYRLFTSSGRLAKEGIISNKSIVNVAELPGGVYLLEFTSEGNIGTKKLIIE
ncbi:MAG: T9SS type A sorting domain-containing protein [Bacteroidetes bacterium]|nr:T9SS type A sorting domain-containing protein [Bacteroidota bacterium]